MKMSEKLSSSVTFIYKIALPATFTAAFFIILLGMFMDRDNGFSPPPEFLIVWIICLIFILKLSLRIKTVILDNNYIIVKNFKKVIHFPIKQITSIDECRIITPRTIILTISPKSEFGGKIVFIPKAKFQMSFSLFREHPISEQLRNLVDLNR